MEYLQNNKIKYYNEPNKHLNITFDNKGVRYFHDVDYFSMRDTTVYTNQYLITFKGLTTSGTSFTFSSTNIDKFVSVLQYSFRPAFICSDVTAITSSDKLTLSITLNNNTSKTYSMPIQHYINTFNVVDTWRCTTNVKNITVKVTSTVPVTAIAPAVSSNTFTVGELLCKGE